MAPGPEEPAQRPTTEPASQVLIRAGVPGKPDLKVEHGKPYPNATTDVAKLLAERGLTVTYEDEKDQRSYVSFYAAEIWIPILQVASSILAGASGNLLSEVIKQLLGLGKESQRIRSCTWITVSCRAKGLRRRSRQAVGLMTF